MHLIFKPSGVVIKAGDALAEPWRRVAVLVHRRFHVLLALLSIPACPALALRLGVGWHYLGHHQRRTGHAPCHPRLRYRADASQSADIPAGDGLGGLADRQRGQFVGSRFSVCENSDERAFERGIDLQYRRAEQWIAITVSSKSNSIKPHPYRSKKEKEMNTNKSTTGIDPKGIHSFRKIAVITGVIFIIATVTGPILAAAAHTCSDWYGLPHSGSPHIRTRWPQECCSISSGTSHVPA